MDSSLSQSIVDAHIHLGRDVLYGRDTSGVQIIEALNAYGVDAALVQPAHDNTGLAATQRAHDAIYELALAHPGRIFGVCSVNPHFPEDVYNGEVQRCVRQLSFVGIKVHPVVHAWHPLRRDSSVPFEAARRYRVPLMVHTGTGMPLALPLNLLPLARAYPDVSIVLCHAGAAYYGNECLLVAESCRNVYLETSRGGDMRMIRKFVKTLGASRVMFGSDGLEEIEHALWMYRHSRRAELHYEGLTNEDLAWCLGGTVSTVFRLTARASMLSRAVPRQT